MLKHVGTSIIRRLAFYIYEIFEYQQIEIDSIVCKTTYLQKFNGHCNKLPCYGSKWLLHQLWWASTKKTCWTIFELFNTQAHHNTNFHSIVLSSYYAIWTTPKVKQMAIHMIIMYPYSCHMFWMLEHLF